MNYYSNRFNWWSNSVEHFNSSEYFRLASKTAKKYEMKTTERKEQATRGKRQFCWCSIEKFGRSFSTKRHHEPCRAPELLTSMKESMAKMATIQDIKPKQKRKKRERGKKWTKTETNERTNEERRTMSKSTCHLMRRLCMYFPFDLHANTTTHTHKPTEHNHAHKQNEMAI